MARKLKSLVIVILALATTGLAIYSIKLTKRLSAVEAMVTAREEADPLRPQECSSDDMPCEVSIARLVMFPQYFHKRKVRVRGVYHRGFEASALYSPVALYRKNEIYDEKTGKLIARNLDPEEEIWIKSGIPENLNGQSVDVVGIFKHGPSGHLGQYRGELDVQEVVQ